MDSSKLFFSCSGTTFTSVQLVGSGGKSSKSDSNGISPGKSRLDSIGDEFKDSIALSRDSEINSWEMSISQVMKLEKQTLLQKQKYSYNKYNTPLLGKYPNRSKVYN